MVAEILAVGTELLLGDIVNTNAQFIAKVLAGLGINVYTHTVVGDNPGRIRAAYAQAFARADLVIATGGLGPTADDITKEMAAEYFGLPLVLHAPSWEAIQRRFAAMGAVLTPNNQKQAVLPEGCTVFPNRNGTAPGLCIEKDGKCLIMLPGPPNEAEPMFLEQAVPFLRAQSEQVFISRTLKVTGVGESMAESMLADLLATQTNPTLAPYAKIAEVWLRITAAAADEDVARRLIAPMAEAVYQRLGVNIYGEDDETLESVVVKQLMAQNLTLACAESCTGGMLAARLINCPGVSAVLPEAFITYSNEAKIKTLGVDAKTIAQYGAVSAQTAAAMAEGAAKAAGTTIGVATTGIAGPDGGTPEKPVGLVYMGFYRQGEVPLTKTLHLTGNRQDIRLRTVIYALDFVRRNLLLKK